MADWQVGDDALCICQDDWVLAANGADADGPRAGQHYKVTVVGYSGPFGVFLGFAEWPRRGYHHTGFIKVTPDADLIEQERRIEVDA